MHGFALNIDPDLSAFERINPCGLAGCPVTSLAHEGVSSPSSAATREQIIMRFEALLNEWLPEENSGNERRMP
jgi:lipoyl(octanoyl) transferase